MIVTDIKHTGNKNDGTYSSSANADNRVFLPRKSLKNTYAHSSQKTNFPKQVLFTCIITIIFALSFVGSSLASNVNEDYANENLVNFITYSGIKLIKFPSNNKISKTDIVIGNKDAKVLFIEYFAPTCTHCREYHLKIYPEIKAKYIDTGKIAYVMREFVGNKQDLEASLLARCWGDKDSYLKLTEHLLLNQETWGFSKKYRENLFAIAAKYGISKDQYNECLNDETKAKVLIDYAKLVGSDKDFIGTPSFYINGKLYQGEYTKKVISEFLETVVKEEETKVAVEEIIEEMKEKAKKINEYKMRG